MLALQRPLSLPSALQVLPRLPRFTLTHQARFMLAAAAPVCALVCGS